MRQLREEEDALLLAAVQAMAGLWQQLQEVRRLQGGRHLTDVAFSVVQLPPAQGEEAPLQAVSAGRVVPGILVSRRCSSWYDSPYLRQPQQLWWSHNNTSGFHAIRLPGTPGLSPAL